MATYKNPLFELQDYGQSVWYDNISRQLLHNGGIQNLIDNFAVVGMTSNPSIFEKAMTDGNAYDDQFHALVKEGKDVDDIFLAMSIQDIGDAADTLRPIYDRSNGLDGYISIEVLPEYAHDTAASIKMAHAFWDKLKRPNIMVKIPGTAEGIPAIRQCTADGLNINITLLFGIGEYEQVMEAYLSGLEERVQKGLPIDRINSVASFFVSRVDTLVDKRLDEMAAQQPDRAHELKALQGKAAIANAKIAYEHFKKVFSGARWEALRTKGATIQRPLWASTSTKNPNYPDTIYVDNLIGRPTVNTMPQVTIDAFADHGRVAATLEQGLAEAEQQAAQLKGFGIDLEEVADELQVQGVKLFSEAYDKLRDALSQKREQLIAERG
ncbi:MAG: transaldolase [Candidatus Chloroheliales bacterium]|nr:MAG: transaldolase [Chloroflexota bacterium]